MKPEFRESRRNTLFPDLGTKLEAVGKGTRRVRTLLDKLKGATTPEDREIAANALRAKTKKLAEIAASPVPNPELFRRKDPNADFLTIPQLRTR